MYINILIITILWVFILDISGFKDEMNQGIWKWVFRKKVPLEAIEIPKPFSCSLCMTWWSGIIYLIVTNDFTWLNLGYVGLLAYMTPIIMTVLIFVKDILSHLFDLLYGWLKIG